MDEQNNTPAVEEEVLPVANEPLPKPVEEPAPISAPIPAPRPKKVEPPKPQPSEMKQAMMEMKEKNREKVKEVKRMAIEDMRRETNGQEEKKVSEMTADALLDKHFEQAMIMGCIPRSVVTSIPETVFDIISSLFQKQKVEDQDIDQMAEDQIKNRESAFSPKSMKDPADVEAEKRFLEKAITELRGLISVAGRQKAAVYELSELFGGDFSRASPQLNRQIIQVLQTSQFLEKLEAITDSLFAANRNSNVMRGFARILDASNNVSEVTKIFMDTTSLSINDNGNAATEFIQMMNEMMNSLHSDDMEWTSKIDKIGDEKQDLASKVNDLMKDQKSAPPRENRQQQQQTSPPQPEVSNFPNIPQFQPVFPMMANNFTPPPPKQTQNNPHGIVRLPVVAFV